MNTVSNGLAVVEKYLAIVLMIVMTAVMALAVLFRYFLNSPLSWAGEASVFLLTWISFIGGSLGLKYKAQASVTFLLDILSPKMRKTLLIIGYVLILIFMAVVLYYSYTWVFSSSTVSQKSNNLQIPMWIPFSAVPFGLSFAAVHILSHLSGLMRKEEGK
ncbi:C4-dicarboxylate transporter, DctQ subunit [Alteribacillus persepolensis]|uniref:C4-dicarboxylate transporter, DctQ subunit n=1 Tax=Alteribacillus persepolensis TaxID=568899 RepID=A0A1G8J8L9_9BACI|nr:TRAP transporter small permease [Alteribacillus persepolensis]SDI27413.1 C4-dicarboxylate transporter, DctQ subunit [Alteribacillus persepolensis]